MQEKYITAKEVYTKLSISRSTFYRRVKPNARFPKPIVISESCVRYKLSEVLMYCDGLTENTQSQKAGE